MVAMNLAFKRRAALFGVVRDAVSGRAIAGATVEIAVRRAYTQTRADGGYWFYDLHAGHYNLRASAPPALRGRYGKASVTGIVVAYESSGKPIFDPRAHIVLPPTRVVGRVTDAASGAPVSNALVSVRGGDANTRTRTSTDGVYALGPLQPGKPMLEIAARGYATAARRIHLTAGQELSMNIGLNRTQ